MFGVSSGAAFAIKFPETLRVDGVVSEVNMPWEKAWGATDGKGTLKLPFPPTAFYEMAVSCGQGMMVADCRRGVGAALTLVQLQDEGAATPRGSLTECHLCLRPPAAARPADVAPDYGGHAHLQARRRAVGCGQGAGQHRGELRGLLACRVLARACPPCPPTSPPPLPALCQVPERAVTPTFFYERSMYITRAQPAQLAAAMRKIGLLDGNGWIRVDPRFVRWDGAGQGLRAAPGGRGHG